LGRFNRALFPENGTPNISDCQLILSQIKILLIDFQLIPPFTLSPAEVKRQLLLARETLELATLLSVEAKDEVSFERHISQVKIYYHDYGHLLPPSERKWTLLGLLLLHLLSLNRTGEFHTELELIPPADRENLYIAFPVRLEKRLMEGTYNKVLNSYKDAPHPSYAFFMNKLAALVRTKMIECAEKAYTHMSVDQVSALLMVPSNQVVQVVTSTAKTSTVSGNQIVFAQAAKSSMDIPAHKLLLNNLLYATELERII